ncbi:ATP-binding protein [Planctomycetota bacterium]
MPGTPASGSIVVKSSPSALEGVYQEIRPKLQDNQYVEDDIFAVHLALDEAFHNAVEHGNKKDSTKTVQIDYQIDAQRVELRIADQGPGFNPGSVPDPRIGANLYRPEGRGILLINAYMDDVKYNETGNQVIMVRYRERPVEKTDT